MPAGSPERSSVLAVNPPGPLHATPNGELPAMVRSMAPLLSPLQVRLVPAIVSTGGWLTVISADPESEPSHPLPSEREARV